MGITRKTMSLSTFGLVDFRSDKERTARHTSGTKKAVKKGNKLLKEQNKLLKKQGRS